jgi:hypothetical protein
MLRVSNRLGLARKRVEVEVVACLLHRAVAVVVKIVVIVVVVVIVVAGAKIVMVACRKGDLCRPTR